MTLKEKFEDIEDLGRHSDHGYSVWSTEVLDVQSTKCVKIADDYAIEFAQWIQFHSELWIKYKTSELLAIFKNEKGL